MVKVCVEVYIISRRGLVSLHDLYCFNIENRNSLNSYRLCKTVEAYEIRRLNLRSHIYRPQGKGNVFTVVCLSTISLTDTGSLLGLVMARLVRILQECFLVIRGYNFDKIDLQ